MCPSRTYTLPWLHDCHTAPAQQWGKPDWAELKGHGQTLGGTKGGRRVSRHQHQCQGHTAGQSGQVPDSGWQWGRHTTPRDMHSAEIVHIYINCSLLLIFTKQQSECFPADEQDTTPTCSILLRTAVVAGVIVAAASVVVEGTVPAAAVVVTEAVREEAGTPPLFPLSPPRSLWTNCPKQSYSLL